MKTDAVGLLYLLIVNPGILLRLFYFKLMPGSERTFTSIPLSQILKTIYNY